MSAQLVRLESKSTELELMIRHVRAKIDWLTGAQQGPEPDFENYAREVSRVNVNDADKPLPALDVASALDCGPSSDERNIANPSTL
jgi:hypothetical protein